MSTQSKTNPLIIIISIAVFLFIASIFWRMNAQDNSEDVTLPKIEESKSQKPKPKAIVDNISTSTNTDKQMSIQERDEIQSKLMTKNIKFRTPEQVMEVIEIYQQKGNDKMADEYIEFLLKRFPDYEMPN